MCGARRQREQSRAALSLLFLVLLLNLAAASGSSQGDRREPVRVAEGLPPPPIDGGGHVEEGQQLSRLPGSRPPCCERKCGACTPCKPVQVRAGAAERRSGDDRRPECANYEPVGWKCKCGAAVFDP
ncbi:unnamed protein product [Urochloa decumbens]|uniref:Epidermal patterning factor-like protein n=1 Tax=Urochloa decumbens TaxID=240449 RepID=A0ABC9AHD1_9POAL